MRMEHIRQFPHCDQKVLHKPGECEYCDAHPDWQELREAWGIAFSGHSNEVIKYKDWEGNTVEKTLIPCPSEWDRPIDIINCWYGNVPRPKEQ
jgi:hypothetical protein